MRHFSIPARTLRAFGFFFVGVFAVLALSACGGGGGGGGSSSGGGITPPANPLPPALTDLGVSVVVENSDCGSGSACEGRANANRNDAEFGNLGFAHNPLDRINAEYAYARGFAGQGVTVAVADHGIDLDHPEFAGRLTMGYNAFNNNLSPDDDTGHGSGVAGILAAAKDGSTASGARMHGVAYESTIIPIRVLSFPTSNARHFGDALRHGLDNAFILNNSWGNTASITTRIPGVGLVEAQRPETEREARGIQNALRDAAALNKIVVFATGNEGWNSETGILSRLLDGNDPLSCEDKIRVITPDAGSAYSQGQEICNVRADRNIPGEFGRTPERFPELRGHWLHVVAVDGVNKISQFSNGCGAAKQWCLAAPGEFIRTANNDGGGQFGQGTSYAAPFVSGAAAVLKSAFPNLGAKQIVTLLLITARDLGAAGVDDVYGHGMLDLEAATRPQTHPDCGGDGYQCPHQDGGLRLATARNGAAEGLDIRDFHLADLGASRITPSPAFGDAFSRADAAAGFVDAFDRAYRVKISGLAGAPSGLQSDAAGARRTLSGMRTRDLADGFFARESADGAPVAFGWRGARGSFSASLAESRNWSGGHSGMEDAAFALGAGRWRGVEFGLGDFRAGFRAAEFSQTDSALRQWFLGRAFEGGGWRISPEAGIFDEDDSLLGADFSGGFAPGGARTFYGKVDGWADLGHGFRGFAGALLARTSAANGGGAARFSDLSTGGWEAGFGGERWRFSLWRPAGVLSGEMRFSGVSGYDESGKYRASESRVDLSANHRRRLTFAAGDADGDVWWAAEKELGGAVKFSISGGRIF